MSRKLNYNLNWLNSIYLNKLGASHWMPQAKAGYKLYELLSNNQASLESKRDAIIAQLREHEAWWRDSFTAETKTNWWTNLRKAIRRNRQILENKNGRRLLEKLIQNSIESDFIDENIISMMVKLMEKVWAESEEASIQAFDDAVAIMNAQFELLPPIHSLIRPSYNWVWEETEDDNWIRFSRHSNKHINSSKQFMSETEMNYGPELEGTFPNRENFELACAKLNSTEFHGMKMYDANWLCIPTDDPTIRNGFSVEWTFAPMSYDYAMEYQAKFLEILTQFGWDGEYSRHGSGIHVHIDANKFNDKTLMKLINNTYDRSYDELKNFYGQESTYNSWNKRDAYTTNSQWVVLKDQFNEDGEQLGVLRKTICSYNRSTLVNLQNMLRGSNSSLKGTIEMRGFNGSKKLTDVITGIKNLIEM